MKYIRRRKVREILGVSDHTLTKYIDAGLIWPYYARQSSMRAFYRLDQVYAVLQPKKSGEHDKPPKRPAPHAT
jgi:predicted site-specific integrase-resolvase